MNRAGLDRRVVPFVLATFALLAVGLAVNGEREAKRSDSPQIESRRAVSAPADRGEERLLLLDARRFVDAFLRYERGERSRSVLRRLRVWARSNFAAQLLDASPRVLVRLPSARIDRLRVEKASWRSAIAVVGGVAHRARRRERFDFLFTKSGGRWLAAGPAS
jgi:hypothetical protein